MTDWLATSIEGVWRRHDIVYADTRGSFTELWRDSLTARFGESPMAQANLSRSVGGVLRGMHFHLHQADLWLLIEGRAVAATTDVRPVFAGEPAITQLIEMEPGDALFIPRRVAHGFLALTDMALVYLVSAEYDGSDELGFAWDDPAVGIQWPNTPAIISDRDRSNPSLRELIATLPHAAQSDGA